MADVTVEVPASFSRYADGSHIFQLSGSNAGEVLDELLRQYPDLKIRLMDADGKLYSYLPFYLNQNKLPDRSYRSQTLKDGDRLEVIAIASGG
ncbi:MAG: MoaD/ThiS family protein [Planctomycetaceae bacterium]